MISYDARLFGFELLFRLHGSALYKSLPLTLVSTVVYISLWYTMQLQNHRNENNSSSSYQNENTTFFGIRHPDAMGAVITLLMFLLQFRTTFSSYGRYWEAVSAVHVMHGKLIACGSELAAFHLQSNLYNTTNASNHNTMLRRPISYGEQESAKLRRQDNATNSNENNTNRHHRRERSYVQTIPDLGILLDQQLLQQYHQQQQDHQQYQQQHHARSPSNILLEKLHLSRRKLDHNNDSDDKLRATEDTHSPSNVLLEKLHLSRRKLDNSNDSDEKLRASEDSCPSVDKTNQHQQNIVPKNTSLLLLDTNTNPSLFLQEAAHLLSLLSAVALSTLRNDAEGVASPLIEFTPGQPFPHIDPDSYSADIRKDWDVSTHHTLNIIHYMFGMNRTDRYRALYNAGRPFRVIGGVSDNEINILQKARGPMAKVALVNMWFIEYITRESLHGSMGAIEPPILSRLHQSISDSMVGYNHARMISYNPFPFVHAELTSFFVLIAVILLPILMLSYASKNIAFGCVFNIITVMCFTGLHEVARELEMPFKNIPNDIPLNNYQGQFNESLMTMFAGYHPDFLSTKKEETTRKPSVT